MAMRQPSTPVTHPSSRYIFLDCLRGILLLLMILYHACWNLVFLFDVDWQWFYGPIAYAWQQLTCSAFILLSGFCWPLGRHPLRRGLTVFAAGILVTFVTTAFMPSQQVLFGILTLLGACMLLLIPMKPLLLRVPPLAGAFCCLLLFFLFRPIGRGSIGFGIWMVPLPGGLYHGPAAAFLGLTPSGFRSSDYFPLLPWLFLFLAGFLLYALLAGRLSNSRQPGRWAAPFSHLGRHSLLVYLLHQPLLYLVMQGIHALNIF